MIKIFGTHNHTEISNITTGLDSLNKLDDLVQKAKELGLSGLAITEHDNLGGVVDINLLQKKLRKEKDPFTLAIGNEIYLNKDFDPTDKNRKKYYHFILIAKDEIGYSALVELSTRAWYRADIQYRKRRVPTLFKDIEEVLSWSKGHLIATSACLGGLFPTLLQENKIEEAEEFLQWCQAQFGYENFFIELQPSTSKEQVAFNQKAQKLFEDKANFIVATDAHYQDKEDFPIFEAFLRSQQEKREVQEFYEFARLMSEKECRDLLKYLPVDFLNNCFNNTEKIREQVCYFDLEQKPKIPKAPLKERPTSWWTAELEEELKIYPTLTWALKSDDKQTLFTINTCLSQLLARGKWNKVYLERLEHEFEVNKYQSEQIEDNFFKYANTLNYYFDLAWKVDYAIGPSRGSASGSLLNWLMDLVKCDPIQYELPFWRYLNKERVTPLDIDFDGPASKREALFAAIRAERGELGLLQVTTRRTLTLKAAIGNAARGYRSKENPQGLDPDISIYLSSLIEVRRGFVATLHQTLNGDEVTGFSVNNTFIKECQVYPGLLEIIKKIEGIIVGSGIHAAAVVFFDEEDPLTNHCSLMRAPNGALCTCLDLHNLEYAGCYKYDFLILSTLDIMSTCFRLLQKDGLIPKHYTLKECYDTYIDPNKLDYTNPEIWKNLYEDNVLSVFQWDANSGRKGILAAKPETLFELTSLNGIIRLMTVEGEEDQLERFIRLKNNLALFENEMVQAGLNEEQRRKMHAELDKYNGCAATQENFMVLSQELARYTLKEADMLRKIVAKKKLNEISSQKEFFYSHCEGSQKTKDYIWSVVIAPSLGYGFSLLHALVYSIIGIQCIYLGAILFPPIYWQTACLLQRSGALDGGNADYNKIAKAVSQLAKKDVNIRTIDINLSEKEFRLNAETNTIYFGFDGLKGIRAKAVLEIFEKRPFQSMDDFLKRAKVDVTSLVSLIKAGAFNSFCSREKAIEKAALQRADIKEKLNGMNLAMISKEGHWPLDTEELRLAQRVFNFSNYIKKHTKKHCDKEDLAELDSYLLDERAKDFLLEIGINIGDFNSISKNYWKGIYDDYMLSIKTYLILNQEEMVKKVNEKSLADWQEKYFSGNSLSQWEIETLGLCFGEHPLQKTVEYYDNKKESNALKFANFDDLSQEPEVQSFFKGRNGRQVPLYKLSIICGVCIAKDKLHSQITLLTPTGPVEIKFRKEQFAFYSKQISRVINGEKKVVEKSWFRRGVPLMIHGMRQDDIFVSKFYKNSKMKHCCYRISEIEESGAIKAQKERAKGIQEEENESDEGEN